MLDEKSINEIFVLKFGGELTFVKNGYGVKEECNCFLFLLLRASDRFSKNEESLFFGFIHLNTIYLYLELHLILEFYISKVELEWQ